MSDTKIDPKLREFATNDKQRAYFDAVIVYGGQRAAARALGVAKSSIDEAMRRIRLEAESRARTGYAPGHFESGTAPGFSMGKVTVQRGPSGEVERTWERQSPDQERQEEMLREFALSLGEEVKGLAPITPAPADVEDDLMCVIPMGDPHFGMHAWWADAGEDFDLKIAEDLTNGAIDRLISASPGAGTALLLNLGDMFHADNQKNTTNSGHQLDVDGRWAKVQQVGLRSTIHCIRRLLEKHARVIFRINRGNHDGHSSYALALMISCYFHNEPRVEVDLSPAVAWYHQFGKNLIGSTHGDTIKGPAMPGIMAADVAEMWGSTKYRVWYVGHIHHSDYKEYAGCTVEYFRTMAARDAWHQGQGYRAGRDMRCIVLHKQFGEIERHRCDVAMLKTAA